MGHPATAPNDNAADGQARFGIYFEWRIAHFLLNFKTTGACFAVFGNGFVNVSRHKSELKTFNRPFLLSLPEPEATRYDPQVWFACARLGKRLLTCGAHASYHPGNCDELFPRVALSTPCRDTRAGLVADGAV